MKDARTSDSRPPAIAMRGDHLSHLVRFWRQRLNPDEMPYFTSLARHKSTVSQEDMARIIGSSSNWYARLERGDTDIYSADFLDRAAIALGLTPAERNLLYLYALGHDPVQTDPPQTASIPRFIQDFVREQTHAACMCDESWHLLTYNNSMAEWFPWIRLAHQPNLIRWAFTSPEAKTRLYNWASEWAPFFLTQMMTASARYPGYIRLNELIRDILHSNELARRLWASGPKMALESAEGCRYLGLYLGDELRRIGLITLTLAQVPQHKIILMVPSTEPAGRSSA